MQDTLQIFSLLTALWGQWNGPILGLIIIRLLMLPVTQSECCIYELLLIEWLWSNQTFVGIDHFCTTHFGHLATSTDTQNNAYNYVRHHISTTLKVPIVVFSDITQFKNGFGGVYRLHLHFHCRRFVVTSQITSRLASEDQSTNCVNLLLMWDVSAFKYLQLNCALPGFRRTEPGDMCR